MNNHSQIKIYLTTRQADIFTFLQQVANSEGSKGKLHLRAVEETSINMNGTSCTFTKLFVRSGRENPFEWLRNTFDSKRQYRLAAKVLEKCLQNTANNHSVLAGTAKTTAATGKPFASTRPVYRESKISLASLREVIATSVEKTKVSPNKAPSFQDQIADFLGIQLNEKEEFDENFASFTRLAQQCSNRHSPNKDFLLLNLNRRDQYALSTGAAKFSLRWAKCWLENPGMHDALRDPRLAEIDRFVIWVAKHYLSQLVNYQALESLSI